MSKSKFEERYGRAFELIKNGSNVREACEKAGVSYGNYYTWRNKRYPELKASKGSSTSGSRLIRLEDQAAPYTGGKIVLLMGSTRDVLEAAKGLL
jgi:hypothetical protein